MATATLTPTNYWQVDYGTVTAKNPSTRYLTYVYEEYSNRLSLKRSVFLEFAIPADAVYRHAVVTESKLFITNEVSKGYSGWRNNNDANLSIGKRLTLAGYPEMFRGYTDRSASSLDPFIKAPNNRFYIGLLVWSGQGDFSWTSESSLTITYYNGVFGVTPDKTGGYIAPAVANAIKLNPAVVDTMMTQYSVKSGVFYYKKTSASSYSSISFTGNTVTIPANTLDEDSEYNYYFTAVSDDDQTATTEIYTVSTGDMVGTVTALSPNNVIVYGEPTFTWLYENALGNLQTAFDLQISTDAVSWSDVATHEPSADTAYTTNVSIGGNLYWRVRSYNQADVASEWSNVLSFSNILPPSPPTITGVSGTGRITVTWNSTNQIAYQVMIGEHDSGWVFSANKSYFLNEYLADGTYEIKVRVTNGIGLVSEWATMSYSQTGSVAGPSASIEMKEGYNEITISGSFDRCYIIRNGVVIAETAAGTYTDYFCNGTDNYVVRGVNADDTFGDSVLTGRYTCRKPALIDAENTILYVNERLDEEPQISSSDTLEVAAVKYLGRTKPVHHIGQLITRTWSVSCSRQPVPGKIYFYRNFRGDKAWVICSNVQSSLNSIGVHEYQFTLEETDYSEAVEYEV